MVNIAFVFDSNSNVFDPVLTGGDLRDSEFPVGVGSDKNRQDLTNFDIGLVAVTGIGNSELKLKFIIRSKDNVT